MIIPYPSIYKYLDHFGLNISCLFWSCCFSIHSADMVDVKMNDVARYYKNQSSCLFVLWYNIVTECPKILNYVSNLGLYIISWIEVLPSQTCEMYILANTPTTIRRNTVYISKLIYGYIHHSFAQMVIKIAKVGWLTNT